MTTKGKGARVALTWALLCGLWLVVGATASAQAPPDRIGFVGKNTIAKAKGVFHSWKIADANVDASNLEGGSVVIEVDVASLDTGNKRRDAHLRNEDFFEVERWPTARVRVHGAEQVEGDRYQAQFDVEIRDQRKTIVGTFEVVSRDPLRVKGELTIDRMEFGIGTPKTWNPMSITEEIPITFEATLP